jgi:hypothetical protein
VIVAYCRGEWAVRLPHAPPHGKPAPLLADEARSASGQLQFSILALRELIKWKYFRMVFIMYCMHILHTIFF